MGRGTARSAVEGLCRVRIAPPPCFAWSPSPCASRAGRTDLRLKLVLLQKVVEGRAADAEQLGGARDVVVGAGQRLSDRPPVRRLARGLEVDRQAIVRAVEVEVLRRHQL